MAWDPKDPDDIDDFCFAWGGNIADGETIASHTYFATPEGLTLADAPTSISGTNTYVRISGGTAGVTYYVTDRIITSTGRQLDATEKLKVKEL